MNLLMTSFQLPLFSLGTNTIECNIFEDRIEYTSKRQKIVLEIPEHTDNNFPLEDIIKSIGNSFYRWNIIQNDYILMNPETLKMQTFYSEGFINIPNNSESAKELIQYMNLRCQQIKHKLLGNFQLILDLGNGEIRDHLNIFLNPKTGEFEGIYSYPGNFEEKILDIEFVGEKLRFKFKLKEGNSPEMKIEVELVFLDSQNLDGTIFIDNKSFLLIGRKLD
jgi:hypothetical protein